MRFNSASTLFIILLSSMTAFAQTTEQSGRASINSTKRQQIIDFAISPSGEFRGVVADQNGNAMADFEVALLSKTKVVGVARTDETGRFLFAQVSPGPMTLRAGDKTQSVRLWPSDVAPPNAKSGVLLVTGDSVIRAQCCSAGGASCGGCDSCCGGGIQGHFGGVFQRILQNPWLVGAGTAAAIAIPLANDDDDERDSDFSSQIQISGDTVITDDGSGEPAS